MDYHKVLQHWLSERKDQDIPHHCKFNGPCPVSTTFLVAAVLDQYKTLHGHCLRAEAWITACHGSAYNCDTSVLVAVSTCRPGSLQLWTSEPFYAVYIP